jgi:hypothetical protein
MKRHFPLLFFLMIGVSTYFIIFPFQDRGKVIRIKNLDPDNEVGRQYLVLIAINKYEHWRGLTGAVKDGIEIREILQSHYYFDKVIELYDDQATRIGIVMLFERLQKELNPEDSVLIFYAGHGCLIKSSGIGYWIPVNGGKDERECKNWISHGEIIGFISNMKAKHIFLIADSCFAGNFLEVWRGDNDAPKVIKKEYFRRAYQLKSRQVLTSGAEETVPDNSIFAQQLKKALKENDRPYLDPIKLYDDIRLAEMKTFPVFGVLRQTGHQEGATYLLLLKTAQLRSSYKQLTFDEVKEIFRQQNFFDRDINQSGFFKNKFELQSINGDSVVVDHATGLMWHSSGSQEYMKIADVKAWLKRLNRMKYAGYNDWRLPTLEEGASLLENFKNRYNLFVDEKFSAAQAYIWTGDTFLNASGKEATWIIFFSGGCVHIGYPPGHSYVRPVRSNL